MLQLDLSRVDEAEIRALVAAQTPESSTLDFKAIPHAADDPGRVELAKDVCAMANADGGDIVFGVSEQAYLASAVVPVAGEAHDLLCRRINQTLQAKVEPRLSVQHKQVPLAAGGYVAVIRVPASFDGPHWIRSTQEQRRFVVRDGTGTSDMTHAQVRAAFDRTGSLVEQAKEFIDRRLPRIREYHGSRPTTKGPTLSVHLIPLSGLAGRTSVDLRALYFGDYARLQGEWHGCSRTFNFDGLVIHPGSEPNEEIAGYVHVFRSGALEGVASCGGTWTTQGRNVELVYGLEMGAIFHATTKTFLEELRRQGFSGPAIVSFALQNVAGHHLGTGGSYDGISKATPSRRDLIVPPEWVASVAEVNVDELTRPMLDMLWQAFGVERCRNFDKTTGVFSPRG